MHTPALSRLLRASIVASLAVFAAGAAPSSLAFATPAITVANTAAYAPGSGQTFTLGYQFTTTEAVSVSALGVFDSGQDGLAGTYPVAIYDNNGTQLAFATVLSGTSEPLLAQFRYQAIIPVTLSPGTYKIGALFNNSEDGVLYPGYTAGFSTAAPVTFVQNEYHYGSTLADPVDSTDSLPSYFGPNFQFTVTSTPEPGSLTLIGAGILAVAALQIRGKRYKAQAN